MPTIRIPPRSSFRNNSSSSSASTSTNSSTAPSPRAVAGANSFLNNLERQIFGDDDDDEYEDNLDDNSAIAYAGDISKRVISGSRRVQKYKLKTQGQQGGEAASSSFSSPTSGPSFSSSASFHQPMTACGFSSSASFSQNNGTATTTQFTPAFSNSTPAFGFQSNVQNASVNYSADVDMDVEMEDV